MGTRVKICGITNLADAEAAVNSGADLLGFIFFPKSPRYVTAESAATITHTLRERYLASALPRFVGVFVNSDVTSIRQTVDAVGLDFVQLHGDEPPQMLAELLLPAYKALRPTSNEEAQVAAMQYLANAMRDGPTLLLDAYDVNAYGGTGKKADWQTAAALAERTPGLLLAGGLTPANVAAAIQTVRPWGVDVSSGVEAAPGRKDHAAIAAFIANARAADQAK